MRRGSKFTLMGQNGAGKSTLFGLITKTLRPESGNIHIVNGVTIAMSRQVIPRGELDLTVRAFFEKCFPKKVYDIDPKIDEVLEIVNLKGHTKIHTMSSRLQGATSLLLPLSKILMLLLDEPTNNLTKQASHTSPTF